MPSKPSSLLSFFHCSYIITYKQYLSLIKKKGKTPVSKEKFNKIISKNPRFCQETLPKWKERFLEARTGQRAKEMFENGWHIGPIFYRNATRDIETSGSGHTRAPDLDHMYKQILAIKPSVIVALGSSAQRGINILLKQGKTGDACILQTAHPGNSALSNKGAHIVTEQLQLLEQKVIEENQEAAKCSSPPIRPHIRVQRSLETGGPVVIDNTDKQYKLFDSPPLTTSTKKRHKRKKAKPPPASHGPQLAFNFKKEATLPAVKEHPLLEHYKKKKKKKETKINWEQAQFFPIKESNKQPLIARRLPQLKIKPLKNNKAISSQVAFASNRPQRLSLWA